MIRFDDRNQRWRWEFDRYVDGERIRRSKLLPRGLTEQQAQAIAMTMESDLYVKTKLVPQSDDWDLYVDGLLADRRSWLHEQVVRTKHRAKATGLAGSLSAQDIADLMRRSRGRCEVTGIRFQIGKPVRAPGPCRSSTASTGSIARAATSSGTAGLSASRSTSP
jgi:hypothetical protein